MVTGLEILKVSFLKILLCFALENEGKLLKRFFFYIGLAFSEFQNEFLNSQIWKIG